MKILKASKERTKEDRSALRKTVGDIIENVIETGDTALLEYNHRFDGCDRASLRISKEEIEAAYKEVPEEDIEDIKKAAANIKAFAQAQRKTMMELKDFSPAKGIMLGHRIIPVDSCCCYVPGGGYPLYSTALMLVDDISMLSKLEANRFHYEFEKISCKDLVEQIYASHIDDFHESGSEFAMENREFRFAVEGGIKEDDFVLADVKRIEQVF